jgi:cytochrome c peroxidase
MTIQTDNMFMKYYKLTLIAITLLFLQPELIFAHGAPAPSLRGVKLPKVPGLIGGVAPIIVSQKYARILGKAFFWDASVGSDGTACASCHYHAGADLRTRDQLNPGDLDKNKAMGLSFQKTRSGANLLGLTNTNYQLRKDDFPFWNFQDPADNKSALLFFTDDVSGSSGTFMANFQSINTASSPFDQCENQFDPTYHNLNSGHISRQVTNRNAPTVINAAFNFRNFWDGRANNIFNGQSSWGLRDPDAGVWVSGGAGLQKIKLQLKNASLASQAVGPPTNAIEMSCAHRQFPAIAQKLLDRRPLATQDVAVDDSVLGKEVDASGKGLKLTYRELIKKAFAPRFWNGRDKVKVGSSEFTQIEANFATYFGLSVQIYENTLISDQSRYDTPLIPWSGLYVAGGKVPKGLSEKERRGLVHFLDAHCQVCHAGPTFSAAVNPEVFQNKNPNGPVLVDRTTLGLASAGSAEIYALRDVGFSNTGVVPTDYDPGQNSSDPWGNPLSFSEQYINALLSGADKLIDPVKVYPCDMEYPFVIDWPESTLRQESSFKSKCKNSRELLKVPMVFPLAEQLRLPDQGKAYVAVGGAFKIPSLRNVELTGPYMHNGGMKSLEEVVEFYNRGGNVANKAIFTQFVFPQGLGPEEQAELVSFLKSLTDPRVLWEKMPFDHPSLKIPHGFNLGTSSLGPGLVNDDFEFIPAVGRTGRTLVQGPLKSFDSELPD